MGMTSELQHSDLIELPEHAPLGVQSGYVLGFNVETMRSSLGMSATDFAEYAGISRMRLSTIESGTANVTLETLEKLARALGTDPWELIKPPDKCSVGYIVAHCKALSAKRAERDTKKKAQRRTEE